MNLGVDAVLRGNHYPPLQLLLLLSQECNAATATYLDNIPISSNQADGVDVSGKRYTRHVSAGTPPSPISHHQCTIRAFFVGERSRNAGEKAEREKDRQKDILFCGGSVGGGVCLLEMIRCNATNTQFSFQLLHNNIFKDHVVKP